MSDTVQVMINILINIAAFNAVFISAYLAFAYVYTKFRG